MIYFVHQIPIRVGFINDKGSRANLTTLFLVGSGQSGAYP